MTNTSTATKMEKDLELRRELDIAMVDTNEQGDVEERIREVISNRVQKILGEGG
ncbi:MAG: hypothetical protein KH050_01955 [Clostridiaceae bacterium]|nr:hypothetical protein [Clostridiaceae bacterium]